MMRTMSIGSMLALFVAALLVGIVGEAFAHGGEDHGEVAQAPNTAPELAGNVLSTEGVSDYFELLLKYAPPERGQRSSVRLFLADYATNHPLEGATFQLSFTPNSVRIEQTPQMISPGIYEMAATFAADTVYRMVATVNAAGRTDFVEVRNIYAGEAARRFVAEHAGPASEELDGQGGLPWWAISLIVLAGAALVAVATRAMLRARRRNGSSGATTSRERELTRQHQTSSVGEHTGEERQ